MEEKGPENLADILAKLFIARGWGRQSERKRLEDAWAAAAGPESATSTRVAGLKRGVLEVEVRGSVLMQELSQFRKRKLLTAIREKLPGMTVTDLKFRSGSW